MRLCCLSLGWTFINKNHGYRHRKGNRQTQFNFSSNLQCSLRTNGLEKGMNPFARLCVNEQCSTCSLVLEAIQSWWTILNSKPWRKQYSKTTRFHYQVLAIHSKYRKYIYDEPWCEMVLKQTIKIPISKFHPFLSTQNIISIFSYDRFLYRLFSNIFIYFISTQHLVLIGFFLCQVGVRSLTIKSTKNKNRNSWVL